MYYISRILFVFGYVETKPLGFSRFLGTLNRGYYGSDISSVISAMVTIAVKLQGEFYKMSASNSGSGCQYVVRIST